MTFLKAVLTDQLEEYVGPSSRSEVAVVTGPGETPATGSITVNVPKGQWVHYVRGSTIELTADSAGGKNLPDSTGRSHLFLGVPLGSISAGLLPWGRGLDRIDFVYLINFTTAVSASQAVAFAIRVRNPRIDQSFGHAAEADVGDVLQFRISLTDLSRYDLEAKVTVDLPPAATTQANVVAHVYTGLDPELDFVTVKTNAAEYLDYVEASTVLVDGRTDQAIADINGGGQLFAEAGATVSINADSLLVVYVTFELRVDTTPRIPTFTV